MMLLGVRRDDEFLDVGCVDERSLDVVVVCGF